MSETGIPVLRPTPGRKNSLPSPAAGEKRKMDNHTEFKKKILNRAEILEKTILELERAGMADASTAERWRSHLAGIGESLQDPLLKIAVVGSVKSGKSTLINAILGQDLLKRGAGIITAFITRVATSGTPGGWVELKPWSQINQEINASLRMLPVFAHEGGEMEDLDIRKPEDRERIASWLDKMKFEWLQSRGNVDPHFMFLDCCLRGFPLIEGEIGEETGRREFEAADLQRHQLYVGDERRAAWVRDIEINCPVSWLGERIELADCQGSDSPNPSHFELLQKYLLQSHSIIYVIGSRTGLREADFKLFDLLKALKVFPQTLFVLNSDLDLHGDLDDLEKIQERVRSELSWVTPDPNLFTFSALCQLLKQLEDGPSKFESRHLKLWKESKAVAKSTESGFAAFKKELEEQIRSKRSQVLLGFGMSRLDMVASNVLDLVQINRSALDKSAEAIQGTAEQIRTRRMALHAALESLAETVSGLNQSLKREMDGRIESCFHPAKGRVVREAVDMVERHPVELGCRCETADYTGLIREYYAFYLEFRRDITRRLTESVNLRIMEFAKNEELFIRDRIRESSQALWSFFDAALADYRRGVLGMDEAPKHADSYLAGELDFSNVPPPSPFSSFLERDSIARGILFLKFGLNSFAALISGIKSKMRKSILPGVEDKSAAKLFEKGMRNAKAEAKAELLRAFAHFTQDLKSDYLFRLVDEGSVFLLREFRARAEVVHVDFADLLRRSNLRGEQRIAAAEALAGAHCVTSEMIKGLEELRREVRAGLTAPPQKATRRKASLPKQRVLRGPGASA